MPVLVETSISVMHPELATEWHPTKNDKLPEEVRFSSHYLAWWRCAQGHEWEATVNSRRTRVGRYTGCPICNRRKVADALSDTHPVLAAEWDAWKNTYHTPDEVTAHNHTGYWWRCSCSNEYEMAPSLRAILGLGCPRCQPDQLVPKISITSLYPSVVPAWHPDNELTPTDVHPGESHAKYRWFCSDCGSDWLATPNNRLQVFRDSKSGRNGCPYCSRRAVNHTNSLATLRPDVAAEWDPEANAGLTPADVTVGSHQYAIWRCKNQPEHRWRASVHNRTGRESGCPYCTESKGESAIRTYLERKVIRHKAQHQLGRVFRFDFVVRHDRLAVIEFHGEQHYRPCAFGSSKPNAKWKNLRDNVRRDRRKELWCQRHTIPLLTIPFWDFKQIPLILDAFFGGQEPSFSEPPEGVRKYEGLRERMLKHFERATPAENRLPEHRPLEEATVKPV